MTAPIDIHGPFIDELKPGQVFSDAPSVTLTDGLNVAYQAIVGSRLQLASDHHLAQQVTGAIAGLANQALVWNVSMGQSTTVTGRVVANLFYRGLNLHRIPSLGDTLSTTTTVKKLRANSLRPGRRPTGLVQLRVQTLDQHSRKVLDFHRCAMLPFTSDGAARGFEHDDDVTVVAASGEAPENLIEQWNLEPWRSRVGQMGVGPTHAGDSWTVTAGDVVSNAPELARLTMNTAAVHHDRYATSASTRLVYGGHTIGIAFHHLLRCLPQLLVVTGWDSCDHTGPVHEGDTLTSEVTVVSERPYGDGLRELTLQVVTHARRGESASVPVLDWKIRALLAT